MIRAEHIVKSFDGRVVLKDISATFATGKTNLIIGQSGSGKTVLLKSLVGLHAIDSGKSITTTSVTPPSRSPSAKRSASRSA